jgi:hypothetical protein
MFVMKKEENENTEQVLNKYFAEARQEPVVVSEEEVEKIISAPLTNNLSKPLPAHFQYWLIGGLFFLFGTALYIIDKNHEIKSSANAKDATEFSAVKGAHQDEIKHPVTSADENNKTKTDNAKNEKPAATAPAIKANAAKSEANGGAAKSESNAATPRLNDSKTKKEYHFQGDATINFESDGKNVSMIIGNEVKRLEIDGIAVNKNDYSKYEAIIEKGKALKAEQGGFPVRKTDTENLQQKKNQQIMNELTRQLLADKLIDETGHFEFRLTGSQLFINNQVQSEAIFTEYKILYEKVSNEKLKAKSNFTIRQ